MGWQRSSSARSPETRRPPERAAASPPMAIATTRTEVRSSIIAGNVNSDVNFLPGSTNSFRSNGYNLIGSGNAIGRFNQTGDQTGVTNPLLGPLADNGGPTWTHAPLVGSPAIDRGSSDGCGRQRRRTDVRSARRTVHACLQRRRSWRRADRHRRVRAAANCSARAARRLQLERHSRLQRIMLPGAMQWAAM